MTPTTKTARRTRGRADSKALDGTLSAGPANGRTAAPGQSPSAASLEVDTPGAASQSAGEVVPAQVGETALPSPAAKVTKVTKSAQLEALLAAPEGATLAGLCSALGWQSHTVRAALTRLRQAGHRVERSRTEDELTVYRIVPGGAAEAAAMKDGELAATGAAMPGGAANNPDANPPTEDNAFSTSPEASVSEAPVEVTLASKRIAAAPSAPQDGGAA